MAPADPQTGLWAGEQLHVQWEDPEHDKNKLAMANFLKHAHKQSFIACFAHGRNFGHSRRNFLRRWTQFLLPSTQLLLPRAQLFAPMDATFASVDATFCARGRNFSLSWTQLFPHNYLMNRQWQGNVEESMAERQDREFDISCLTERA